MQRPGHSYDHHDLIRAALYNGIRTTRKKKLEATDLVESDGVPPGRQRKREYELTPQQQAAFEVASRNVITFLSGAAGSGKTYFCAHYAAQCILQKKYRHIILTRPLIEAAGERLGWLPGSLTERTSWAYAGFHHCLSSCLPEGPEKDRVYRAIEVVPLAYARGRTFDSAVCILDEAQNLTKEQFRLWITRLGKHSTMLINGDPSQSDLPGPVAMLDIMKRLWDIEGIGAIEFTEEAIVRHPLLAKIIKLI